MLILDPQNPISYLTSFIAVFYLFIGRYLGSYYMLLLPIIIFIIHPYLELILGEEDYNPTAQDIKTLEQDIRFRIITIVWSFIQIITLFTCLNFLENLSLFEYITFMFSTGIITGGIGINVSHELMHKNTKLEKFCSKVLLTTVCYNHFFIEHIHGHHKNIGTTIDCASSKKNESVYTFVPRSICGGYINSWKIEDARLTRKGYSGISINNSMIRYTIGIVLMLYTVYSFYGSLGLIYILGQSLFAVIILEITNFIEHYGLTRNINERINEKHSWNANSSISNLLLFKLQRHSDHHIHPSKRYQTLHSLDSSPQLPTGYTGCILLALVSPLWRLIMNSRIPS